MSNFTSLLETAKEQPLQSVHIFSILQWVLFN